MATTFIEACIEKIKSEKKDIALYFNENVYYIVMNRDDNKFDKKMLQELNNILDSLPSDPDDLTNCSLVTLSTHPRIFCNGLDLPSFESEAELKEFLKEASKTMGRLVSIPMPTVALINGHAFGLGFYIALCHDYIVMRNDKGYLCFSEMKFGATSPESYIILGVCKIGERNFYQCYSQALQLTAAQALERDIITKTVNPDEIYTHTQQFAEKIQEKNTDSKSYGMMKKDIFKKAIYALAHNLEVPDYVAKKVYAYKAKMAKL